MFKSFFERNHLERNLLYIHTIHTNICITPLSPTQQENDLKTSCNIQYMPGVLTKNSPKKLEYWKEYRRRNAVRCREQRSEWREANRERIRLCARRSYYRKLLRLGQGDKQVVNAKINELDIQIMKILASEN